MVSVKFDFDFVDFSPGKYEQQKGDVVARDHSWKIPSSNRVECTVQGISINDSGQVSMVGVETGHWLLHVQ